MRGSGLVEGLTRGVWSLEGVVSTGSGLIMNPDAPQLQTAVEALNNFLLSQSANSPNTTARPNRTRPNPTATSAVSE